MSNVISFPGGEVVSEVNQQELLTRYRVLIELLEYSFVAKDKDCLNRVRKVLLHNLTNVSMLPDIPQDLYEIYEASAHPQKPSTEKAMDELFASST